MTHEQSKLFATDEAESAQSLDIDEIARQIAVNSRPFEYEDRTSEAAADQGYGPQNIANIANLDPRLFEMPGTGKGRNNPNNEPLSRSEILRGMSPEDIERQNQINKLGAQAARQVLENPDK